MSSGPSTRLARTYPAEVDGYRRYLKAAMPAVQMVLDSGQRPAVGCGRSPARSLARRGRGAATLLRWSRRSAADVMRSFFTAEALRGPAMVAGPMVWGVSPEMPGTGLGALTYAMRHVGAVGRPVGGSGMVPERCAPRSRPPVARDARHEGRSPHVRGRRVRGVGLTDGTEVTARIVVSACNPHDTFLEWLQRSTAAGRVAGRSGGGRSRTTTATSRRSTPIVDRPPTLACARPTVGRDDRRSRRHSPRWTAATR